METEHFHTFCCQCVDNYVIVLPHVIQSGFSEQINFVSLFILHQCCHDSRETSPIYRSWQKRNFADFHGNKLYVLQSLLKHVRKLRNLFYRIEGDCFSAQDCVHMANKSDPTLNTGTKQSIAVC